MSIGTDRMSKEPPHLPVPLTQDELAEIESLAKQADVSPGALGASMIEHMLDHARAGALPMVPDCDPDDDTELPVLPRRFSYLAAPSRIVARVGANKNSVPRLDIPLRRSDLTEMANLARQANTSPAMLGQIFIRQLLGQVHAGSIAPMRQQPSSEADASSDSRPGC